MSKALLLDVEPILGLRDGDALKFAATIAHRFSRPALQEVLSEAVPESIDKHILETKKRSSAYTQTEHVRLVIARDERLRQRVSILWFSVESNSRPSKKSCGASGSRKDRRYSHRTELIWGPLFLLLLKEFQPPSIEWPSLSESTAWANCITSKRVDGLVPRTNCCHKAPGGFARQTARYV